MVLKMIHHKVYYRQFHNTVTAMFYFISLCRKVSKISFPIISIFGTLGLAACQTTGGISSNVPDTGSGLGFIEGKGYPLTWAMQSGGVISIPDNIALEAKQICIDAGYDRSYAHLLEFDTGSITGYFQCRGQGGG